MQFETPNGHIKPPLLSSTILRALGTPLGTTGMFTSYTLNLGHPCQAACPTSHLQPELGHLRQAACLASLNTYSVCETNVPAFLNLGYPRHE
jgi:hypothetical protein